MRLTQPVAHKKPHRKRLSKDTDKNSLILLDQFTQNDLRTWQRMSDGFDSFHIRLYYHLEGLRNAHHEALCEAIQNARSTSIELTRWVRIVDYRYSLEPLSPAGSIVKGGRFNIGNDINPSQFPPFPALYIAENYNTAYAEKFGVPESVKFDGLSGHELALRKPTSFSSVNILGKLNNLFDISKTANIREFVNIIKRFEIPTELKVLAKKLGMSPPYNLTEIAQLKQSLLLNNWRAWPVQMQLPANPQIFGRLIMEAGFEGIIYPSIKGKGKCIAIFPENLAGTDSYVELSDKAPDGVVHMKLDAGTWVDLTQ